MAKITPNASEDEERLDHLFIDGQKVHGTATLERVWQLFTILNMHLHYHPTTTFLGIYLKIEK